MPGNLHLSRAETARDFVERTGVDAFAVNIGQAHLHGRGEVRLDLSLLAEIKAAVSVPLVLHGASSVCAGDVRAAVRGGIRKINVGSILKQTYFEAMRAACREVGEGYNPYEVIGSGLSSDVLVAGRQALKAKVEELMKLFGSAGQAEQVQQAA
jgi:fructose/tagatose bisphosphate aldolase